MEIKGYVYVKINQYTAQPEYQFWNGVEKDGSPSKYWIKDGYVPVQAHTITFEPIDQASLIEGQVMCLMKKREELESKFNAEVRKIDDTLAQLKCLTFDASGVAS